MLSLTGSQSTQGLTGSRFTVSIASAEDRNQIYRIRHDVYASELRQHAMNGAEELRDSLDTGNVYIVVKIGTELAGFISITPPGLGRFSMDKYFRRETVPFPIDESIYEIRLLTVIKPRRGRELAMLLMYAAFRWAESHGARQIVAIGRREILDLYLKVGLRPLHQSAQSGSVTYELLCANVERLSQHAEKFSGLLARIESRTDWKLNISYSKPAACFHGGAFFSAIGERFDALEHKDQIINADVLDAWFEPSPRVIAELREHLPWIVRTSPPTGCSGLIQAIAEARGVLPHNVLPGAGSSDLIFRAFRQWLSPKSHALILDPTYGEYAHILEEVIGCTTDRLTLRRENCYDINLDQLENALSDEYDLVVIVNPNSPTGRHIARSALERTFSNLPSRTRVWVDETYVDYVGRDRSLERFAAQSENVVVCKSMSKVYALSGLRVAYLCAGAHQLEQLRAITPPWVVGLPGQIAAAAALQDEVYYAGRHAETHSLREHLAQELRVLGWHVLDGVANFLLCHLPAGGISAGQWVVRCRQYGLFLRDASAMGASFDGKVIRIAVKDAATNERMVKIIRSVQSSIQVRPAISPKRDDETFRNARTAFDPGHPAHQIARSKLSAR